MTLIKSEQKIKDIIEKNGYTVETFSKKQMREYGRKTPDFKVYKNDMLIFFCEVKCIEDFPIEMYDGKISVDKDENKVLHLINVSCNQFMSVNYNHTVPNVLAIYCERLGSDINDFKFAFEAKVTCGSGNVYHRRLTDEHIRIESKKNNIDLCLWYDEIFDNYRTMYLKESKFKDIVKELIK